MVKFRFKEIQMINPKTDERSRTRKCSCISDECEDETRVAGPDDHLCDASSTRKSSFEQLNVGVNEEVMRYNRRYGLLHGTFPSETNRPTSTAMGTRERACSISWATDVC